MKIRIRKTTRPRHTYKTEVIDGQTVQNEYDGVELQERYAIEYEAKKKGIFGQITNTYWNRVKTFQTRDDAEEIFDWMVENNCIRTSSEILRQTEIDI